MPLPDQVWRLLLLLRAQVLLFRRYPEVLAPYKWVLVVMQLHDADVLNQGVTILFSSFLLPIGFEWLLGRAIA
eukprot:1157956-Pelagomonas_calceolata.AAC.8